MEPDHTLLQDIVGLIEGVERFFGTEHAVGEDAEAFEGVFEQGRPGRGGAGGVIVEQGLDVGGVGKASHDGALWHEVCGVGRFFGELLAGGWGMGGCNNTAMETQW